MRIKEEKKENRRNMGITESAEAEEHNDDKENNFIFKKLINWLIYAKFKYACCKVDKQLKNFQNCIND